MRYPGIRHATVYYVSLISHVYGSDPWPTCRNGGLMQGSRHFLYFSYIFTFLQLFTYLAHRGRLRARQFLVTTHCVSYCHPRIQASSIQSAFSALLHVFISEPSRTWHTATQFSICAHVSPCIVVVPRCITSFSLLLSLSPACRTIFELRAHLGTSGYYKSSPISSFRDSILHLRSLRSPGARHCIIKSNQLRFFHRTCYLVAIILHVLYPTRRRKTNNKCEN